MYATRDWMGFRCIGSSATTYGKKACGQDHEPVDLSSTSDNEGQDDQTIDLSSTSDNEGQDDQTIDLISTSDNKEDQDGQTIDLSSTRDNEGQDDQTIDLSSSDNEGQSNQPVRSSQVRWNVQFEKLGEFKEKHSHCELFCAVARFPSS
jgi:hypothetical protein